MTKMTKRDWFEAIAKVVEGSEYARKDEALEFIAHEIELLQNRRSTGKLTATQKENVAIREKIKVALAEIGKPVTITELIKGVPAMAGYSNQKLSALLRQMKDAGEVVKTVEKKKAYFSLAEQQAGESPQRQQLRGRADFVSLGTGSSPV